MRSITFAAIAAVAVLAYPVAAQADAASTSNILTPDGHLPTQSGQVSIRAQNGATLTTSMLGASGRAAASNALADSSSETSPSDNAREWGSAATGVSPARAGNKSVTWPSALSPAPSGLAPSAAVSPTISSSSPAPSVLATSAAQTDAQAASSSSVIYAFADSCGYCTVTSPTPNQFASYYNDPSFKALTSAPASRTPAGGIQVSSERFFIPWDALSYWNGTQCAASPANTNGGVDAAGRTAGRTEAPQQAWQALLTKLADAKTDGLTPEIAITAGTGIQPPNTPANTTVVPTNPNPNHAPDAHDFACGVEALMTYTAGSVNRWEAYNEPDVQKNNQLPLRFNGSTAIDTASPYNTPSGTGAGKGTWKAAALWYIAQTEANYVSKTVANAGTESVAAATISSAQRTTYLDPYVTNLEGLVTCKAGYALPSAFASSCPAQYAPTTEPIYWAVHDYDDPSWGTDDGFYYRSTTGDSNSPGIDSGSDILDFSDDLAQQTGLPSRMYVWITESAVRLDDPTTNDDNYGSPCPTTIGQCNYGLPDSQYFGAYDEWFTLSSFGTITDGNSVTVTRLDWYQFRQAADLSKPSSNPSMQNGLTGFDSGVEDVNGGKRTPYCFMAGVPEAQCTGSSTS